MGLQWVPQCIESFYVPCVYHIIQAVLPPLHTGGNWGLQTLNNLQWSSVPVFLPPYHTVFHWFTDWLQYTDIIIGLTNQIWPDSQFYYFLEMVKRISLREQNLLHSIRGLNFMSYLGSNLTNIIMEINHLLSPFLITHSHF